MEGLLTLSLHFCIVFYSLGTRGLFFAVFCHDFYSLFSSTSSFGFTLGFMVTTELLIPSIIIAKSPVNSLSINHRHQSVSPTSDPLGDPVPEFLSREPRAIKVLVPSLVVVDALKGHIHVRDVGPLERNPLAASVAKVLVRTRARPTVSMSMALTVKSV